MEEKIVELIKKSCALTERNIIAKTKIKDLSMDSLSFIEFVVNAENEFKISFEDEDLDINKHSAVGDLFKLIKEKVNETEINE